MATNPNYLANLAPIPTVDPNTVDPYAAGYALAQQQMGAAPPAPASLPSAPPASTGMAAAQPQQANALASMAAGALPPPAAHRSFRDIVGSIGDVLGSLGGHAPVYKPFLQQQAFAGWQANPDDPQAQANFLAAAPADAFNFMQQRQINRFAALKAGLDLQQQQRANAAAAVGHAATILKGVRDAGGDVGQAYDQLRATGQLDPIGMHPGEHDDWRQLIVSTPGVLDQLADAPATVAATGGANSPSVVVDAKTGRPIATGVAGVVPMTSDQRPYATAGTAPGAPDASGANFGNGGASDPANSGAPAIVAGNNHGALKDGPFARSQPGYAGPDASGVFATFKTPGAGIAAQEKLLRTAYLGKGVNTVNDIVDKYAPAGPENSQASRAAYKSYVASQLGVAPDAPLSGQQLRPLATAMRNFETGNTASGSAPITAPGSIARGATAPAGGVQGAHWLDSETTGQLDPVALHQAAQQFVLTGAYPPSLGRGGVVQKQILNEVASMGYSTPQIQAIQARTASDVQAQKALGAAASTIQAQEGAAQSNADLVLQKASAVYRGTTPVFNEWRNAADRHTGDPKITALDAAIGTFVSQFATVMGGGQPTDHLQKEWEDKISAAQSPEQLKGVIATMKQDMANRSKSYADRYNETTARIANSLPVPVNSPDEARALPKGTVFITHDGRFKTR